MLHFSNIRRSHQTKLETRICRCCFYMQTCTCIYKHWRGWTTRQPWDSHTTVTHFHINNKDMQSCNIHTVCTKIILVEVYSVSALLSLCFSTTSSQNICPSLQEPSGGERMSVTATMVAHILLWRPCLSCSRQPARNYDILTLDKYHTAGCESNVFYFLCATLQLNFCKCP